MKSPAIFHINSPLVQRLLTGLALGFVLATGSAFAGSVLFIGNSFTYAWGSAVRFYRADTVTDLNSQGIGGVPALFKSFTSQAGLSYDVYLETQPAAGIDWHLENKLGVLGQRPWDAVVMHGTSTLDTKNPGDSTLLINTVREMSEFLLGRNPAAELWLMATWPRADQTYDAKGAWYGKPIEAMARDVRAGYDQAAAGTPRIQGVVPVGEAWVRAMQTDVADANPYDGIDAGKLDLWAYDHYHASAYGSYLEALVLFGRLTGRDPRSLGDNECSGFELGFSSVQEGALQQVAFDELAAAGAVNASPLTLNKPGERNRCAFRR